MRQAGLKPCLSGCMKPAPLHLHQATSNEYYATTHACRSDEQEQCSAQ